MYAVRCVYRYRYGSYLYRYVFTQLSRSLALTFAPVLDISGIKNLQTDRSTRIPVVFSLLHPVVDCTKTEAAE